MKHEEDCRYNKGSVILHIPHSSTTIPKEYIKDYYLDEEEIQKELLHMTDMYTDDLFQIDCGQRIVFQYSRLFCDVERFIDSNEEPMEKVGMGFLL